MNKRITLTEGFDAWAEQIIYEGAMGEHIPISELYELAIQSPADNGNRGELLNHLTRCPICLEELKDIFESIEEAEDWDPKVIGIEKARDRDIPSKTPEPQSKVVSTQKAKVSKKKTEFDDETDLPLAAADHEEDSEPMMIETNEGIYTIEIVPYLEKENRGVIMLSVEEPYRVALEGKTVSVTDGGGRVLLKESISDGEVTAEIDNFDQIIRQFKVQVE